MSIPVQYKPEPTTICKYESPDSELNIYPYDNLSWLNYVERFKFKIPETIITKADGESVCNDCGQRYVGYQYQCVRPRYGYEFNSYHNHVRFGHKLVGEDGDRYDGKVTKSGLYPCGKYCTWNESSKFYEQNRIFSEFSLVISKMCSSIYISDNLEMDKNDVEKWNLIQQIDQLKMENERIIHVLKEVAFRLNAGGAGLMGQINF